jgi:ubiquilin
MFGGDAAGLGAGGNPMAGGMGGMAAGGMPDMAEMQRTMMQNPEQMQAMLNSPLMDSLMNNPELARSLMLANPQVRELIERNPEIGHVLNDSNTLRQMMQMARNPSLMNEMMRNTDRQMANIEMMPGGFDALRRMHENIQAPLMDATARGFAGGADQNVPGPAGPAAGADNPFASLFQPQNNTPSNAPMPNPWAPNRGIPAPQAHEPVMAPQGIPPTGLPNANNFNAFANLFRADHPGAAGDGIAPGAGAMPGFPGGMPGGPPGMPNLDQNQMMQMLENPMVQNMMESVLSDPAMVETMIASNPQLQAMMQANPEMGTMLRDPATLRTFLNPGVMRSMMQMRSAIGNAQTPGGTPVNPFAGAAAALPEPAGSQRADSGSGGVPGTESRVSDMNELFAIMRGLNPTATAGAGGPLQAEPALTDEQLEPQLQQLRDMGFLDRSMCLQALQQARGNVNLAIEHLLSRFGN